MNGYVSLCFLVCIGLSAAQYGYHRPNVIHKLIDEHHEVHDDSDHNGFGHYQDYGHGHYQGYGSYYYGGHHGGDGHHQSGGYGHQQSSHGYQPPQVVVIKKIIPLSTTTAPTGR